MSYDLNFRSRSPGRSISREAFARYFKERKFFSLSESQAWYSNEDSGVYFSFDYANLDNSLNSDNVTDPSLLPVSFNLNFFRPHSFGLEADFEVSAFVNAFNLTVSDPQISGMGNGEYTTTGFLDGWNAGNEVAYRAFLSQDPTPKVYTLPSARIEAVWRWNFGREDRQSEVGDGAFVPRIFFVDLDGYLRSGVVWGDGIPILLPVVDLLLVPREELAPRTGADKVLFAWGELEATVGRFDFLRESVPCYELFYDEPPSDIQRLIRQKQPPAQMPKGLAFDQLLDQELVEKVRASN